MPDLLKPANASLSAQPSAPEDLMSSQNEQTLPMPADTPPPAKEAAEKKPSRLFTVYYGPLFLLLVSIALVVGYIVLRPLMLEYKTLTGTVASAATLFTDEQTYLESLQRSIAAAQSIPESALADINEALPMQPDIPKLLQMLAAIAEQNRISLNSVQFTPPRDTSIEMPRAGLPAGSPMLQEVGVSMSLASPGYAATRQFLDALERNLRIFDVDTIMVSASDAQSEQTYSVQLRTYVLSPSVRP
ncbi:MAG: Pilus assembly protein PilO [Candidatus Parcubacteria bacterium]|jgi:hypothetical protein